MKPNYFLKLLCGFTLVSTLLWSCSDDEDSPEVLLVGEATITLTTSAVGPTLDNVETVSAQVQTENSDIDTVRLYLGNEMLATFTEEPYNYEWNTRSVEDGEYELRASVTLNDGQTVEESLSVEVLNQMLTFTLDASVPFDSAVLIMTNSAGEVLEEQSVGLNEEVIFYIPKDFDEDRFNLSIGHLYLEEVSEGYYGLEIETFHDLPRGTRWTYRFAEADEDVESTGFSATVNLLNANEELNYGFRTGRGSTWLSNGSSVDIELSDEQDFIFVSYYDPATVTSYYGMIDEVNSGETISYDVNLMQPEQQSTVTFEGSNAYEFFSTRILGTLTGAEENSYLMFFDNGLPDSKTKPIAHPDLSTFDDVFHYFSAYNSDPGIQYSFGDFGGIRNNVTIPDFDIRLNSSTPQEFSFSSAEPADYFHGQYLRYTNDGGFVKEIIHSIHGPGTAYDANYEQVIASLEKFYEEYDFPIDELKYRLLALVETDKNSYDEFLDGIFDHVDYGYYFSEFDCVRCEARETFEIKSIYDQSAAFGRKKSGSRVDRQR